MKTIKFNPNAGTLSVKVIFLGKMVANYKILLREKGSNAQTSLLQGDNTNPEDDTANLPIPVVNNDQRRLILETGFYGLDPDNYPDYEIRLEIYQNNQMISFDIEKDKLSGKGQYSLIFILLTK